MAKKRIVTKRNHKLEGPDKRGRIYLSFWVRKEKRNHRTLLGLRNGPTNN